VLEFSINMPESETPSPVATIRILETKDFVLESMVLGYVPGDSPEMQGMSFQMQCDKTQAKMSIILLNEDKLDISTLLHEIRHAYFWHVASPTGSIPCNVYHEEEEEQFCRRLDTLVNRAVCTIEATKGFSMKWRVI
jgi:hypothetical protein